MPATTNDFPTITPAATKIPASFSGTCPAAIPTPGTRQVVTESLATMELNLTRPAARDLIPYTERGFSRELEAAVAWWMFPGFDEQNRQFRSYHRSTAEQKTGFPPDERIFFDEITTNLDTAESLSTISADMTLFRGITPGVAGIVLNSSAWNEAPFAGTSYDITVSLGQYADRDASGYVTVLVIPGRTGENALYINEDQREFLLPRGTSWDVVSIKTVKDLSVHADFILHNQTGHTARFSDVRLIYLGERKCV
ncbi:MAG TPA: hypothetical protein VHN82_07505 [Methanoregula sp.]|nr:hypothetical protein [Methanoregula sp.]